MVSSCHTNSVKGDFPQSDVLMVPMYEQDVVEVLANSGQLGETLKGP